MTKRTTKEARRPPVGHQIAGNEIQRADDDLVRANHK